MRLKNVAPIQELQGILPEHGLQTALQYTAIHAPSQGVCPGSEQSMWLQVQPLAQLPSPPGQHAIQSSKQSPMYVFDVLHCDPSNYLLLNIKDVMDLDS